MPNERINNALLTLTPTIAHTVSGGQVAETVELEFLNTDTVNRELTVWFVPSGETLGDEHKVFALSGTSVLQPGKLMVVLIQAHLQPGDVIRWAADSANKVRAGGSVKEVTDNGHKNIPAQFLGTSLADLHTITASFASTIISILLCNQSATATGAEIQIVPSGDSAAAKHRLTSEADLIQPGETRIIRLPNTFQQPLSIIKGKADTATRIVVAGAVFEEAT